MKTRIAIIVIVILWYLITGSQSPGDSPNEQTTLPDVINTKSGQVLHTKDIDFGGNFEIENVEI